MSWFHRKPNFRKMAVQLEAVENGLRMLDANSKYVPSPRDVEILARIRWKLKDLPALAEAVEKESWQRVVVWQNTPYTPAQLLWRRIAAFFGWWIGATLVLAQSVFGWVVSWFPSPLYMFATSAAVGFLAVALVAIQEHNSDRKG
jgi:hypothetical protein